MNNKNKIIRFFQKGEATFYKGDGSSGDVVTFQEDQLILVSDYELFAWIEKAKSDNIKMVIYETNVICSLN